VRQSTLAVRSAFGVELRNQCAVFDPPPPIGVVLFPGDSYRCDAPLLYHARQVCLQRGADVLSLEYGHQVARTALAGGTDHVIEESASAVTQYIRSGHRRLIFISKSLGTWVSAQVAARCPLPVSHVFLTPVPRVVPIMRQSGGLVIVGTADPVFDRAHIDEITDCSGLDVRVVADADHGLTVPKDYRRSVEILGMVCRACDEFLERAAAGD